jgi:hypothetical protein
MNTMKIISKYKYTKFGPIEKYLICIDDVTDILNFGDGIKELTYGKEYEILHLYYNDDPDRPKQCSIINDRGIKNDYRIERFVDKSEFRNITINKILK